MYTAYTDAERLRYWIQMSHESREEYMKVESMIGAAATKEKSLRDTWRPAK
jgi:hypothetical protein